MNLLQHAKIIIFKILRMVWMLIFTVSESDTRLPVGAGNDGESQTADPGTVPEVIPDLIGNLNRTRYINK